MVKDRLKLLRENKGLSKTAVAKALELPYTTYLHYEDGSNQVNNEVLVKFAVFYGVSTDWILGVDSAQTKNLPPETRWEILRQEIEQLSDEDAKELHSYIKFLLWREQHSQDSD